MSHNQTSPRPDEEVLTALLILAAIAFGSLFAVAKTVGNHRFIGHTSKKDERGTEDDEVEREYERLKEQGRGDADSEGMDFFEGNYMSMEDNNDAPVKSINSQILAPQDTTPPNNKSKSNKNSQPSPQRTLNHQQGLASIRAWEDATTARIRREKVRRLSRLPALEQREIGRREGLEAIASWERSTMGRFRRERVRRLEELSLRG